MHYVSADSLLFCFVLFFFLSNDFSSVLIVMQVVAVRLCFVDDAICCVNVETKSRLALNLTIQWCSNFPSLTLMRLSARNKLKEKDKEMYWKHTASTESGSFGNKCRHELTKNNIYRRLMNYQHDKDHTSYTHFHEMQNRKSTDFRNRWRIYPLEQMLHFISVTRTSHFIFFYTVYFKVSWHTAKRRK